MQEERPQRKLAAILAVDVVGYSRLMERDETGSLSRLRSLLAEAFDPTIHKFGGRVFKNTGDGALAEFASAVDAVQCAIDIQRAVARHEAEKPQDTRLVLRMGISLGDVIVEGNDLYGNGVNIAARMESLSEPGTICVSANVFEHVGKALNASFEDLGEQRVKNLDQPVRCYRIDPEKTPDKRRPFQPKRPSANRWRWGMVAAAIFFLVAGTGSWWIATSSVENDRSHFRLPDRPSVAVLPLDSFNNEKEQRFLAEGIAEDIITELSRNSELTVMARSATFALREKGLSAKEIAAKLDVHYVLEGSVRRAGNKLRISAQLIGRQSGNHVWAERYDATASKLYETQDAIVAKIVGTLFSEVRETEKARILRRPPRNLDVYELSLRGLARKHRLSAEDLRLAREDLLRAVELDPHYAPARLYLGWVEVIAIIFKWIDGLDYSDLDKATASIEKAIEMDPNLATAYQALSLARTVAGDVQGALQAARRSIELGPGDADNLLFYARALASNGQFTEAVSYARHAIALNPSRPSYYAYHLGRALWGRDKFGETNNLMKECLTKAPGFTACRIFQIASHMGMGNSKGASRDVAVLLKQSPNFTVADAIKSVGFGGDKNANGRLAKQLIAAGLSENENRPATR